MLPEKDLYIDAFYLRYAQSQIDSQASTACCQSMKSTLISLAVGLVAFIGERKVNACPGFCDQEVDVACDAFLFANGKEQTALAASKVFRAYDSLAAGRNEFQSPT